MTGSNTRRRRRRLAWVWGLSLVPTLGLGLMLSAEPTGFGLPAPFLIALCLILAAALIPLQIYYWRSIDEVARAIQASAFLWSGMITWMLLLLVFFLSRAIQPLDALLSTTTALEGAYGLILVHLALHFVLWGWAWLKRR